MTAAAQERMRTRLSTKARARALNRLADLHRETFEELLREERAALGLPGKWERP
jgi:hypothetical protein